jgi:hypothetical protein
MQSKFLNNYGYVEDYIPQNLYDNLLTESKTAETNNKEMISGLTREDVVKHFYVIDTKDMLKQHILKLFHKFNETFPGLQKVKYMSGELPIKFADPWFNFQRKGEYVPNHIHHGIYSYSLWLKIPTKCRFEFTYTNIIGDINTHKIDLTEKDEGKIVFFPSRLPHIAYPFNDSDDVRISVSGNLIMDIEGKK